MVGCLVLAFALCNPNYGYNGGYAASYAYAGGGYYQPAPQAYYQPQYYAPQPVYVAPPVYYSQPYYGGYRPPFGMGGIGVAIGRHGGVAVNVR